jgi:hypothetical protein|tara:strand:- start:2222 stop:2350 length:129 start_codon:yes stop_codon:yes gene_type:complete
VIKTGHKTSDLWISKQAIWMDKDMFICGAVCLVIGLVIGVLV